MNFTNTVQAVLDGPDISLVAGLELEIRLAARLAGGLSEIAAQSGSWRVFAACGAGLD